MEKILLVEDEIIIQMVMKAMLEKLNYNFDLAQNGKEALSKANMHQYTLILMDLGLPDIRGTEVAATIKHSALNKATPVVVITGFSINEVENECQAVGIQSIYNKPMDFEKLKNIIKTYSKNCLIPS